MRDSIKVTGRLDISFRNTAGDWVLYDSDPNLIIDQGKVHFLNLLAGRAGALKISKMEIGDGGCGVSPLPTVPQLFSPLPFGVTDTNLRHSLALVRTIEPNPPVDSFAKTVQFTCFFNSADVSTGAYLSGIPNVVNEYALKSADDIIVALTSRKSIPFDQAAAVGIRAVWTLNVG